LFISFGPLLFRRKNINQKKMDSSPYEVDIRLNLFFFSKLNLSGEVPSRSKVCKIQTLDYTTEKEILPLRPFPFIQKLIKFQK
jgi:hypothetical protein